MKQQVPVLSLSSYTGSNGQPPVKTEKDLFVSQLFEGLKKYGFVILKDHPIKTELLRRAYSQIEKLFNMTEAQKESYYDRSEGGQRGYTPFGKEHAKDSKFPDLKEFWHVGRDLPNDHELKSYFADNVWPKEVEGFKDTFQSLFKALDDTGRIMLEALTIPLDVPKTYFSDMTMAGSSILRLLHYPPIHPDADPNCIRAAAHEDINLITLLVSAQGSGLELLTREGEWIPVETSPENIIVDSGDMLARITNEVLPATTHRVVNPKGANKSRYSMPFFMHPNPTAMLKCIPSCRGEGEKYPPIMANDFLMERLREIGLKK